MTVSYPFEADLLSGVDRQLKQAVASLDISLGEARLQVLEGCAAILGGFDLGSYYKIFNGDACAPPQTILPLAAPVVRELSLLPIPAPLALSALAREALDESGRKATGAYHTDFRLAQRLAKTIRTKLSHRSKVLDPACGAGILLVALTIETCSDGGVDVDDWLAENVCAADMSEYALRGALLSLASLTPSLDALRVMRSRWYCGDSLIADERIWKAMAPLGFDAVIGNPPWDKLKLTRHEFLRSAGVTRHYGEHIQHDDSEEFQSKRAEVAEYARKVRDRYPAIGAGERDLYIAFTDLFITLCAPNGSIAVLVPGGLIRSQGTEGVRRRLFENCTDVSVSIIDNKSRFFAIDSRFKFLAVFATKPGSKPPKDDAIRLMHERGTPGGLELQDTVMLERQQLLLTRRDYSLPEVRNAEEWALFQKISYLGFAFGDKRSGWSPEFCREVDMTKGRLHFRSTWVENTLPVIEGRMVHQHRFGVKAFESGSGRKAIWQSQPMGRSEIRPQFWIERSNVPSLSSNRTDRLRVGFCDITGQTNERSLMAAMIERGTICGNKVPTIIFPDDPSEDRLFVWLAIANSFAFDWMIRRIITTTVNYFLLQSIPMPRLDRGMPVWTLLAEAARTLHRLDTCGSSAANLRQIAELRALIDVEVAVVYGLDLTDVKCLMRDFPLLDRGQPAIPDEPRSTVTADLFLARLSARLGVVTAQIEYEKRCTAAFAGGAFAYIPSSLAKGKDDV